VRKRKKKRPEGATPTSSRREEKNLGQHGRSRRGERKKKRRSEDFTILLSLGRGGKEKKSQKGHSSRGDRESNPLDAPEGKKGGGGGPITTIRSKRKNERPGERTIQRCVKEIHEVAGAAEKKKGGRRERSSFSSLFRKKGKVDRSSADARGRAREAMALMRGKREGKRNREKKKRRIQSISRCSGEERKKEATPPYLAST